MASEPRVRTREAQIERLERRLARVYSNPMDMVPILRGILDVLKDDAREAAEGSTS